jgi:hypothetical protein
MIAYVTKLKLSSITHNQLQKTGHIEGLYIYSFRRLFNDALSSKLYNVGWRTHWWIIVYLEGTGSGLTDAISHQFPWGIEAHNEKPEPIQPVSWPRTASVVQWSEFLATDPEVGVRFPALPNFLSSSESGTGSTQPRGHNWGATWMEK